MAVCNGSPQPCFLVFGCVRTSTRAAWPEGTCWAVPWTQVGKTGRPHSSSFHPRRVPPALGDTHWRAQYGTMQTKPMGNSRLTKFMRFSNRLCFYGIGLIGVLYLVAYHTSVTLFPFDSDLLAIFGILFALIAILFFSIDRT